MIGTSLLMLVAVLGTHSSAQNPSGTWPFNYPADTKPGSLLDLRYLNERVSGETGYVRVAPDGRGFVRGDGKPIRFWPVCSYGYRLEAKEMPVEARFLAKMGVNMVRIHAGLGPKGKGKPIDAFDADEIDHIQRYVAAIKQQGIYATISPFWANGGASGAESSWGLGYGDGEDIWGLLFFDDSLKAAYKVWVKHLYADNNPYTGVPLAKDPTVAIAQVQNEDGLFFWTFQGIKPAQKRVLARKFGTWLVKKFGSVDNVKARWQGAEQAADEWATLHPVLLDSWVLTQPQSGGMKTRTDDQTAFLIDFQKAFYAEMDSFYKNELGYKGMVNACNWITADPVTMNDLERYTYLPTDVEAVNRYYNGGVHNGPNAGWRIDEGDFFSDVSALRDPRSLPFNLKQVVGHPMIITESAWVSPLGYQAEGPMLDAAYQSLSGIQGLYWFEIDGVGYNDHPIFDFVTTPDGSHPPSKWTASIPQTLGQFPAAALLYRMGYVQQGPVVVHEERTRESLDAREVPVIAEDPSFDPNHFGGDVRAGISQAKGADPLAFLVGPVEEKFDGDPAKTRIADLSRYIDHERKTVKSDTGQLWLDYGRGLFKLDAPKAQGVAGFLRAAGGRLQTTDVTFDSPCDYAAITVVPLDDKPISQSGRLLVQVGTVTRMTGWQQEAATVTEKGRTLTGWKVTNTGKMPWQIQDADLRISVRNPTLQKVIALDPAGYPLTTQPGRSANGQFSVRLPAGSMYYVLE